MGFFDKIFGAGGEAAAKPIEAFGNVIDELFTSKEEKLDKQALLERIAQSPGKLQVELNKIEAQHRTVFVAGWRPAIGWVLAAGLFFYYPVRFAVASYLWLKACLLHFETANELTNLPHYPLDASDMLQLVLAMLGMAGIRTYEKMKGKTK